MLLAYVLWLHCEVGSVFAEEISRAKAQRREALPRFLRFSLRLCAFAREIVLVTDAPWVFCAKPLLPVEACGLEVKQIVLSGDLEAES